MSSTNWQNLPSTNTPLNATNLNKIEKKIKTYYIPTNIAEITGWYLVASGTITGYDNIAIKLSIVQLNSGDSAILYTNLRSDEGSAILEVKSFKFETNTGINSSHLKLRTDGKNYYLYFYCENWNQYQVKIISISNLKDSNKLEEDLITIYTPTASNTVSEPNGINPKYRNKIVELGNGTITSNDIGNAININNIDFDKFEAISIQLGNPAEGDSKVILFSEEGEPLNDIVHLDNYATSQFYCKAYAYMGYSSGHVGYISIVPKELAGWLNMSYKVWGIQKN